MYMTNQLMTIKSQQNNTVFINDADGLVAKGAIPKIFFVESR